MAHPLERLARGGKAGGQLECGQRHHRDHGEQHHVQATGGDGRDAHGQAADHRQRRQQRRSPWPMPAVPRVLAGDPAQPRVERERLIEPAVDRPAGGQLGRAARRRSTTAAVSSPRAWRLPGLVAAGEPAGQPRERSRAPAPARPAGSGRRPAGSTTRARPSPRRPARRSRTERSPAPAGPAASRRRATNRAIRSPLRKAGRPAGASSSRRW